MKRNFVTLVVGAMLGLLMAPSVHWSVAAPAEISSQVQWKTFGQTESKKAMPEVKAIQFLLRARGFYKAQPDGIYGSQTVAAVKAFQRSKGLKVDGVVGAQTFPKLVQTVRRGSRGDTVRAAQILIREFPGHEAEYPYADLKVDGIFGYNTESAVRDYQDESQVGGSKLIKVSGAVTQLTWALFFHSIVYS